MLSRNFSPEFMMMPPRMGIERSSKQVFEIVGKEGEMLESCKIF